MTRSSADKMVQDGRARGLAKHRTMGQIRQHRQPWGRLNKTSRGFRYQATATEDFHVLLHSDEYVVFNSDATPAGK